MTRESSPYLFSCSRKEIPNKTTFEYTHEAEKHEKNGTSGDSLPFTVELDMRESDNSMHLRTNSELFSSRDWSIICATSMAWDKYTLAK